VIVFEKLYPDVPLPHRGTSASAGYDLAAYLTGQTVKVWSGSTPSDRPTETRDGLAALILNPGEKALVPLGFKAQLPPGIEAQVRPRSGTSVKTDLVIANAPGTIDPDYAEEWCVPVKNGGPDILIIKHGDRIAQAVFAKFDPQEFTLGTVQRTGERVGGFGSTGTSAVQPQQPQRPV
jgi:dUTP pyrophosphatase